jgi:acyl-CoA reductase-like NAD-dependent aldehyde dehydrogenase
MSDPGDHGWWSNGEERLEGERVEVRSPWDQHIIGTVRQATRAHAIEAVDGLVETFPTVRALSSHERRSILMRAAEEITRQAEDLAQLIVAEAGKPIKTARVEVERAASTFQVAAEEATRQGGEVLPLDLLPGSEGRWGMVRRFPVGPILAISPFNFPLNLVAHKLAPAIAAGCPVLLKPAHQTPFCSLRLASIISAAGWPAGALAVMPLANDDAEWLLEHEDRLKALSFTGSAKVGWALKQRAAKKRVLLELGGNAAMIIHGDWPDMQGIAAKAVTAAMSYAGQSCISVQRVFVERRGFHTFWRHAEEAATALVLGDPASEATDVGPMIRPSDAERVEHWIKEACASGAKLLTGGERDGSLVEPTILTGTRSPMKIRDEEVFGPVMTVEPYDDFEDALHAVNQSRYGLQAGVCTRDAGKIFQAYEELQVGAVIIGDTPTWRLDAMPYGGIKDSGSGREGIRYAIEEMTERKLLVMAL